MITLLFDSPTLPFWCCLAALLLGTLVAVPGVALCRRVSQSSAEFGHRLALVLLGLLVALFPIGLGLGAAALFPRLAGLASAPILSRDISRLTAASASLIPVLGTIWLFGAIVGLLSIGLGVFRLRRIIATGRAVELEGETLSVLVERAGLSYRPRLVESNLASGPFACGWRRGVIVLPRDFSALLARDERDAVILHELVHLARGDFAANLVQRVGLALCWCHPGAWLAVREIRRVREECCDDAVVRAAGAPAPLARALVHLEEIRIHQPALVLAGTGGELTERVRRLLRPAASRRASAPLAAGVGALLVTLSVGGTWWSSHWAADLAMSGIPIVRIAAADPAGPFTLEMAGGVVRGMTVNGRAVEPARLRQEGHRLQLLGTGGAPELALDIQPSGGIHWIPRPSPTP